MSDRICSTCGAKMHADQPCQKCKALTAIWTAEPGAPVRVTPPVASDAAFSEGLPPMPARPLPERRRASPGRIIFAMLALAVVITSVSVLVIAVQKVREAAGRTQSINNLKQIGLAGHGFFDANKRLPFNGSAVAVGGVSYSLEARPDAFTSGSWGFQLLAFEQSPAFTDGTTDSGIAMYMCPGRGRPSTSSTPAVRATTPPWSDYVINPWLNDAGGGCTDAPDVKRTLVGIIDGSSNTIFFGHGQIRPADYSASDATPGYLDTILIGGTTATALSSNPALGPVTFARDSADMRTDAARGFGSPFPQGCLMCMCDGTVRMFPYSMEVGAFNINIGSKWGASARRAASLAAFLTPCGFEVSDVCFDP